MGIFSFWKKPQKQEQRDEEPQDATLDADSEDPEGDLTETFARVYVTRLWFESMPGDLKREEILKGLQAYLGKVSCPENPNVPPEVAQNSLLLMFQDHRIQIGEGELPMQMLVMKPNADESPPSPDDPEVAMFFHQSWLFPDAAAKLSRCRYAIMVSDLLSMGMDSNARIKVYQTALFHIVKALQPVAIQWQHSQQFLDAQLYLQNVPGTPDYDPLLGVMNVRMFRLGSSEPEEFVMDTLGLSAVGFPDLQLHFTGLDPNRVANMLNGLGHYIFEEGDVIEDGHTVGGWEASQRWRCRHESSVVPPKRIVIDINPGHPFVAGNRG